MKPFSLNIKGNLRQYDRPLVMGVLNATPDSFYAPSRVADVADAAVKTAAMVASGVDIIDVGACSTRPGAEMSTAAEEIKRLEAVLPVIRQCAPAVLLSVDTYHAEVARRAVELGADIINDVSGGSLDEKMFDTVAELGVPYILGHMRGTPADMQEYAVYDDVTGAVLAELGERLGRLALMGVNDVIVDPGFGFSKTLEQNYQLLAHLDLLQLLHRPIAVGFSRKSMITGLTGSDDNRSLCGTSVLNAMALERGAAILRVHDVAPAADVVKIYTNLTAAKAK